MHAAFDNNEWFYVPINTDICYATSILVMLEKVHNIRMFCGSLSVFTNEFYNKFSGDYQKHVGDDIKSKISEALQKFIDDKNNELTIILENQNTNLSEDFIIPYENFKYNKNVKLYVIEDFVISKSKLNHFVFTENEKVVCLQINKNPSEFICKIGSDQYYKFLDAFNNLLTVSKELYN